MRPIHRSSGALAFILAAQTVTYSPLAYAQGHPVQPVPYNQAPPPVPYGQATLPAGPSSSPGTRPVTGAGNVGNDVIYMKNGGLLRGTIIDAIPNSQARIQIATGEIATVPWSEIARIEHGATTPAAAPAPAPAPGSPEKKTEGSPGQEEVLVHIESPSNVELQVRDDLTVRIPGRGSANAWRTACSSPCDRRLPAQAHYRIAGDGARPSREFTIPPSTGPTTLTVSPASTGWFVGGIVLMGVGGPVMIIGLVIGAAASVASNIDGGSTTANDWARGGWTTAALGATALIIGVVALAQNVHSKVNFGAADAAANTPGSPWAHVGTWRAATPESRAVPAAIGVPLLTGSF